MYSDAFEELAGENNIEIVDTRRSKRRRRAPPTAQISSIAGNAPDVIMAAPLGAQCATFASELVNAKAANPGWEPRVYITNTCASPLILGIAGAAADGLITSTNSGAKDIGNAEVAQADPEIVTYIDYMTARGEADTIPTSAAGWTAGEVTVAILAQAAESPDGLTRASIINAARNFEFTPSMGRDGIVYKMNGEEDAFLVESTQIVQYDAAAKIFNDIGELITEFEIELNPGVSARPVRGPGGSVASARWTSLDHAAGRATRTPRRPGRASSARRCRCSPATATRRPPTGRSPAPAG